MPEVKRNNVLNTAVEYRGLVFLAALVLAVIIPAVFLFEKFKSEAGYLAGHSILEGICIFIYIMTFLVTFYSYSWSKNLRTVVIGVVLVNVALIDVFHNLTYEGTVYSHLAASDYTAFKLYAAARLLFGIGILAAAFITMDSKRYYSRTMILTLVTFINILFITQTIREGALNFPSESMGIYLEVCQYIVIGFLIIALIKYIMEFFRRREPGMQMLAAAVFIQVVVEALFTGHYTVTDSYEVIGHLLRITAGFLLFQSMFTFSVRKPYAQLADARADLGRYTNDLKLLVEEGTAKIREVNEKLLIDLGYARDIKKMILPAKHIDCAAAEMYSRYAAGNEITGQFYDLIHLDNNSIGILTGNISSRGIPSTMLSIFLDQTIRTVISNHELNGLSLKRVLEKVLKHYDELKVENDISLMLASYNPDLNSLVYAYTGTRNSIMVFDPQTGFRLIELKGSEQRNAGEDQSQRITEGKLTLKGKQLVVFFPGCSPDTPSDIEQSILRVVEETLKARHDKPLVEVEENITHNMTRALSGSYIDSDIAFVVMRIKD